MRAGFSMVEALVTLVLATLVGSLVTTLLWRQGTAAARLLAASAARAQRAEAVAALGADLAALAHGSGRLLAVSDSVVELDATVGIALACQGAAAGGRLVLVAAQGALAAPAADGWARAPATGDSVRLFDAAAGQWVALALTGASTGRCAAGTLAGPARVLALTAPLPAAITEGTPVEVRRRVRWSAYRASDQRWYLGEREWLAGRWATVQPAAGPLEAPAPRPFALVDAAGAPLPSGAPPVPGARLEVRLALDGEAAVDRWPLVIPIRTRP